MKKKIVCSVCGEIIEIDDDSEMVYCPKCSKPINVLQGEKYFNLLIFRYYNLGVSQLYNQTDYEKAIESFKKVVELNPSELSAVHGLALATLLTSTLRKSHLQDSLKVLKDAEEYIKINSYNIDSIIKFLQDTNKYLEEYKLTLENRLMAGGLFYEEQGKDLYVQALKDMLAYKEFIKAKYYVRRHYPNDSKITINDLNKQIEILKNQLEKDYPVMITPSKSLDSDKEDMLIVDRIFKDNRKIYKRKTRITIWTIISFVILVAGIILIFALRNYLIIGVSVSSLGLLLFLIFSIIGSSLRRKLAK